MKPARTPLFPTSAIRCHLSHPLALAVAAVLTVGGGTSQAAVTWNSAGLTDNWSTAAGNENWNPGGVVWTQNESAVFDATSGTPEAINVTTANTVDNITFDISGFTIASAGAGSFVLANDLSSTITVTNAGDSATINETFANNSGGPSTLTKAGLGTLTLFGTAANTHSGGTTISEGTLAIAHAGSLGTGSVVNNATLNLTATTAGNITYTGLSNAMSGTGTVNVAALLTGTTTRLLNGNYSDFTGHFDIGVDAVPGAGKVQMNGLDNAAATITILPNATVFTSGGTHLAAVALKGGDTGESLGQLRLDGATTNWAGPIVLDGVMTGANDGLIGSNAGPATISGAISEMNGPRDLTKAGGGTMILSGINTYTGVTRSFAGNISVAAINNTGIAGPIGPNSTIALGNLGNGSTLIYTGTGETTDRIINLGGNNGNAGINHSGTGLLKFTSDFTATGTGTKNLVITNTTVGDIELTGNIADNMVTESTGLATAFAANAATITLASIDGITVGAEISGTGIAPGTTVTAINAGTRVVTISPVASGAGTVGQPIVVTGVVNRTGLVKDGNGLLPLAIDRTYTGVTTVNAGIVRVSTANGLGSAIGLTRIAGNLTNSGRVELTGGITTGETFQLDSRQGPTLDIPALSNLSGNNTVTAQVQGQMGGSTYNIESQAGLLTLSGGFTLANGATGTRPLQLQGAGDGLVSGDIVVGTGSPQVNKQGTGTWTLTGNNTYTGPTNVFGGTLILGGTAANASNKTVNAGTLVISGDYSGASGSTTVNAGTLRLDYSGVDTGKLGDFDVLTLSGGTVELAGGTHAEIVASTTLGAGKSTLVTRSSGSATLNLRSVNANTSGVVVLNQPGIATTDTLNTNGILHWARVMVAGSPVLAKNSTDTSDGPIVAFTGFSDIPRLGPFSVPNGIANTVRIINGGTAGNLTLAASPLHQISFLQMDASEGPATIAFANPTDVLMVGDEAGGSIWQTAGAGSLTIGLSANDGVLTTGNTDNLTPAGLAIINSSPVNPLTINSTIANNATDAVSLGLTATGPITLGGNVTATGAISLTGSALITLSGSVATTGTIGVSGSSPVTIAGDIPASTGITTTSTGLLTLNGIIGGAANIVASGSVTLNGNNSFTGALTINNGSIATLTGNNAARPAGVSGRTVVNSGGILQLQANAANTTAGVTTVLGSEATGGTTIQPLHLLNGGLIQLRSDSSVTFAGGNTIGGLNAATVGFDVGGAGSNQTLAIAPDRIPFGNAVTINVTGANDYALSLGNFRNVTGTASVLTLNPTTANLILTAYSNEQANANASTLVLGGTALGNLVSGPITNQSAASTGTGIVNVTKNNTGTWTLGGANTYTGTTTISAGILKAGNATAFNTAGALSMSATGTLDLNGFNAQFGNVSASAVTNLITDTSTTPGVSTLAITAQAATVAALVTDGPARAIRVNLTSPNSGTTPFTVTNANTFSGGLTLMHQTTGTRLRISAAPTTVGTPGAIVSSPFGTGPITIGLAATDKAGMLLDTAANFTIVNAIVFNTALGTDQPGIRLDTVGHVFSGTITANLSNALFGNVGAATLTGQLTGPNGLVLNASAVTITLANTTVNPNNYFGDTTIGAGAKLVLGANNQLPDGASAGNVINSGTLNLAGFSDTINGLAGAGVVTSSASGGTLTIGGNNASTTFTGSTSGSLALTKIGSGIQSITGAIGHTGDTTVAQGMLVLTLASNFGDNADIRLNTGGTLIFGTTGTDVIDQLFLNNVPQAVGKWGRLGSIAALGADHETALISGDGLLNVTTAGGTPFSLWAAEKGLDGSPGKEAGPTDDPDHDGKTNLVEFGFDGNPLSGANDGKIVGKVASVGGQNVMTLTLPVRTGATFSGTTTQDSATIDGVTYHIQGSDTLAEGGWTLVISEVTGADATVIQTGLPVPSTGWSYRTFRSPGTVVGDTRDFLRAGVE